MTTLKGGLPKNSLLFSLEKKYMKDFMEMLDQTEKYVWAKEAFEKHGTSTDITTEEKKEDKLSPIREDPPRS